MTIRKVAVANPHRVGSALLVPATRRDSYRVDQDWRGVGDYDTWQYNKAVDAVRQFPKNGYEVGDTVEMVDFQDLHGATMVVEEIRMIVCATITDEDLRLLGYRDRAEWIEQTEGGLVDRHAWLLVGQVKHIHTNGAGLPVATVTTKDVEAGTSENLTVDLRDYGIQ